MTRCWWKPLDYFRECVWKCEKW